MDCGTWCNGLWDLVQWIVGLYYVNLCPEGEREGEDLTISSPLDSTVATGLT